MGSVPDAVYAKYYTQLELVRRRKPLIHHIVNYVAMNDCANVTLSLGASPVMTHHPDELEDIVSSSSAVYVNLGTPDEERLHSMLVAVRLAERYGVPVVLDMVGVGATRFRRTMADKILSGVRVGVVKGNGGEVLGLLGGVGGVRGVDSAVEVEPRVASEASEKYGCVVAVTGVTDCVASGGRLCRIEGGSDMFTRITGAGDMAGSVIASFLAVNTDPFDACIGGLATFKAAGGLSAAKCGGPGSFRAQLLDELFNFRVDGYTHVKISFEEV